jgi:hypothetical protein
MHRPAPFAAALAAFVSLSAPAFADEKPAAPTAPTPTPPGAVTHSVLICGAKTFIRAADGSVAWSYPGATRDGWVLENGNVLLAVSKGKEFPGGGVVEVDRSGKVVFSFKGTQSEVNTVQPLAEGRVLLTEAGEKPRILEIDRTGKVLAEVAIQAQTKDHHHQTRMTRKLPNGNYLVPQMGEKCVREYTPEGKVAWEVATPNWPFTVARLDNGHTLISCTVGNLLMEVDKDGKTVWQLTDDDLPGKPIKDACGAQRLPNGNTVVTCYRAGPKDLRMFEVTPDKKIVWSWSDEKAAAVHAFQVLDTNGEAIAGPARK